MGNSEARTLALIAMNLTGTWDPATRVFIGTVVASRSDLLKRVERWTHGRKIKLCRGISSKVIIASEAMLAHGLTQDEIDRWMKAYKRKDFEALKIGYNRKRRTAKHCAGLRTAQRTSVTSS